MRTTNKHLVPVFYEHSSAKRGNVPGNKNKHQIMTDKKVENDTKTQSFKLNFLDVYRRSTTALHENNKFGF